MFERTRKNLENHICLKFFCNCLPICTVNLWKIYARKLRGIILLQFELITFRFAYGRSQNSSCLWFLDFWTCPFFPKPIIFIFGDTRTPKTKQEIPTYFRKILFYKSRNIGIPNVWQCSKRQAPDNDEYLSNEILSVLDMGSISIQKHEMEIWWYVTDLFWKHKRLTKKPIIENQETKKPFLFTSKRIPSTPQHTDSHPCTRPPSWGID